MRIRAKLLAMGLTLKDWARLAGISYPQVCLAVHGHRTDQRSQQIMKMLEEFKGTK